MPLIFVLFVTSVVKSYFPQSHQTSAMKSISISAPRGNSATATVERAGFAFPK